MPDGGALGRIHFEDRLAVVEDVAFGHLIVLAAGEDVGQRRLAGAVRAHDGGDLAGFHRQVQAADDFGAVIDDAGVQVLDLKHFLLFRSSPSARARLDCRRLWPERC